MKKELKVKITSLGLALVLAATGSFVLSGCDKSNELENTDSTIETDIDQEGYDKIFSNYEELDCLSNSNGLGLYDLLENANYSIDDSYKSSIINDFYLLVNEYNNGNISEENFNITLTQYMPEIKDAITTLIKDKTGINPDQITSSVIRQDTSITDEDKHLSDDELTEIYEKYGKRAPVLYHTKKETDCSDTSAYIKATNDDVIRYSYTDKNIQVLAGFLNGYANIDDYYDVISAYINLSTKHYGYMSTDQEVQNTVEDGYFVTTDIQNKDLFSVDEKIADKENCDNDILSAVKKSVCSKLDVYVDANYAKILYSDGVYDLYDNNGYVCQVYLTAEEEALFQSVISTMNVLEDGIAGPYDFDDESISSALEVSDELDAKVKTFTNQKNQ